MSPVGWNWKSDIRRFSFSKKFHLSVLKEFNFPSHFFSCFLEETRKKNHDFKTSSYFVETNWILLSLQKVTSKSTSSLSFNL